MAGVAWYDIKGKGWLRDIFIILHPPYTLWHLSYIPIGAALAPVMNWAVLGWTILAFFLGMGIGGHCLDELNGRPLRTKIPDLVLGLIAAVSIWGAIAIGIAIGIKETVWTIPCIIFGGFIVFAYNMEWPRDWSRFEVFRKFGLVGFFHRDIWFGIAWGAFPTITAYVAQTHSMSWACLVLALFSLLYSMAQRKLSLHARFWRRKVGGVQGSYETLEKLESLRLSAGTVSPGTMVTQRHVIIKDDIIGPADLALKYMTWAVVSAAAGLLIMNI